MERTELFNKSVDVLVKAYKSGSLSHYNCQACAVGNLVSAGMERPVGLNENANWPGAWWYAVISERFD